MTINSLSGNFQPPAQTGSGNALPEKPAVSTGKTTQSNPVVAANNAPKASVEVKIVQKEPREVDIQELNNRLEPISQNIQRGLRFQVDDITGDTVISVIDRQTDETIRQIPPEELLNLSKRLKEVSEELDSVRGILIQTDA